LEEQKHNKEKRSANKYGIKLLIVITSLVSDITQLKKQAVLEKTKTLQLYRKKTQSVYAIIFKASWYKQSNVLSSPQLKRAQ
jgi:hypothetical protein